MMLGCLGFQLLALHLTGYFPACLVGRVVVEGDPNVVEIEGRTQRIGPEVGCFQHSLDSRFY